jgi:8-oxo-dGTP pyrophosphatase MutT (NUDIX family)
MKTPPDERLTVGAIIVDTEGRVLVQRRSAERKLFPGLWDIPGGHVEPDETPLEALAREVYEETGWRVTRIVAELGEWRWRGDDGVERRETDYVVEVKGDLSAPNLDPGYVEYAWVGPTDFDRVIDARTPEQLLVRDLVARGVSAALDAR